MDSADADGLSLGPHPRSVQIIWFSSLIVGQAGLALLSLTFLFAKCLAPRLSALYDLVFLALLDTIVYLILFYSGEYRSVNPSYSQCLVQAALKYGNDSAFILSSFLLVYETLKSAIHGPLNPPHSQSSRGCYLILRTLPYFSYLIISACAFITGLVSPVKVIRLKYAFFCIISDNTFSAIMNLNMIILASATIICQAALLIVLLKRRKASRKLGIKSVLDTSQILRISIFNLWELLGLLLNTGTMVKVVGTTRTAISFLSIDKVPLSVFLIFASQKDILKCWYHSFCTMAALPRDKSCPEHYQSEPTTLVGSDKDYLSSTDENRTEAA
ncbi:hypothetical protein SISNIDRAFT_489819 [Sistotremastrum niveocremeum HHB9708]|uniref:G-protein coupled receptors family 1 profile domain-containing protein n=1 Tax=Sistotremastrum niveocremeum HHB9708 TaxID=1314777 RepID=A0A164PJA4_9AGAM|nr:hypothetical protein SISNIDRAFT_489819 [Sistotremastrum niveocremeum HHB9708]